MWRRFRFIFSIYLKLIFVVRDETAHTSIWIGPSDSEWMKRKQNVLAAAANLEPICIELNAIVVASAASAVVVNGQTNSGRSFHDKNSWKVHYDWLFIVRYHRKSCAKRVWSAHRDSGNGHKYHSKLTFSVAQQKTFRRPSNANANSKFFAVSSRNISGKMVIRKWQRKKNTKFVRRRK